MTVGLTYHDIVSEDDQDRNGFPGPVAATYKLTPELFEQHLEAIAAAGVSVGTIWEETDVALTFDDGGASALYAASALERHGWRGQFFIITDLIGTPGFLTRDGIRELAQRGHEVGSHSCSHRDMGALDQRDLATEWRASREILGAILGQPPQSAALPGIVSMAHIAQAAAAGYRLLVTPPMGKPWHCGETLVHGRFTIRAGTPSTRVALYARGDTLALSALLLAWRAKIVAKRLSPRAYGAIRQQRMRSYQRSLKQTANRR